jgi:hypothetical protein
MNFIIVRAKARDGAQVKMYMEVDASMYSIPQHFITQTSVGDTAHIEYNEETKRWERSGDYYD